MISDPRNLRRRLREHIDEKLLQTRQIDGMSTVLPWTRKGTVEGTTVLVASGAEGDPPHLTPLAFNVLATKPDTCAKRKSLCVKMGRVFAEAMAMPEIEGNPLDEADIALFEMFERENWPREKRLAYIRDLACKPPAPSVE